MRNSIKHCRICRAELADCPLNKGRRASRGRICNPCFNTAFKSRKAYKDARTTDTVKKQFCKKLSLKISNFIQDSVKRDKVLEFSYSEIGGMMQLSCNYCGSISAYNGLDRIDSSKGYLRDNVVPCCKSCNFGKNTLTAQEYLEHCRQVVRFNDT